MSARSIQAPECPQCQGTGWKTVSVDRRVPTVSRCECQLAARAARLLALAEIPRQYEHCTLETFDVFPGKAQSLEKALLIAKKFVEKYPFERDGMLLWGSCGTGKTHLAIAILKQLIEQKGARCLFRGYSALLKQIQATYSKQVVADEETGVVLTEYSILRDVTEAEVLVLDDLGAEQKQSEWTLSMLYHVINERYNARRTTIITTNLAWETPHAAPLESLTPAQRAMRRETLRDRISERTYSRITEMCPLRLEFVADDYRKIRGARDKTDPISHD